MAYRGVLWDMDGTVLDTLEDLWAAVNVSLRQFSLPEASLDAVRSGPLFDGMHVSVNPKTSQP